MIVHRIVAIGLLMLAPMPATSQDAPDWTHTELLTIELSNFHFAPATIRLKPGQAYDLRLANQASGGHDFAAKEFFAAAQIMASDRAKVADGKVSLRGGQTVDVHLVTSRSGTYAVRCTHFMHSSFGMTGEIVVQ